jgi:mRNA interferase MazF
MKRGEIWSVSGAAGYGSKPRPALIVQSDKLSKTKSVITCGITSVDIDEVPFRTLIDPTTENGLHVPSAVMVEKLLAIPRDKSGKRIGELSGEDMMRVEQAMLLVLGFAG